MGLTPEDERFLQGEGERIEDPLHDLEDRLQELDALRYGKAIVGKAAVDSEPKLLGYILPLQQDQGSHLVILTDGSIFVTEPRALHLQGAYKEVFSTNEVPDLRHTTKVSQVKQNLLLSGASFATIKYRNDNPDHSSQINEAVDQGLALAEKLKEQREQAMKKSAASLLDKINTFLGYEPKPPQGGQPPPFSPPSP